MSVLKLVDLIRSQHFAFPAASDSVLQSAGCRNVPSVLLDFYSACDGALIGEGDDFTAPDGRRFRLAIPRLRDLQTVQECGYIPNDSPLFAESSMWWQVLDYGDGNCLAFDATPEGKGRILDTCHESVGTVGSHDVVATSLTDMLERVLAKGGVYWFDDDFTALGVV